MLALLVMACTTDFFLEPGTDGSTGGAGSGESSTSTPTTIDPTTSTLTGSAEESTGGSSTTTVGATESGSDPTTDAAEESSTTTETAGDPTTEGEATAEETSAEATTESGGEGGVLGCPEVDGGQEACEDVPECDWYGDGPCFADACHPDAGIACDGFVYEACLGMPLCTWFGVPEEGECGLTPCGELEMGGCLEAPGCEWLAEEPGTCVVVECPECFGLGELDCVELEQCTWFDAAQSCAAD